MKKIILSLIVAGTLAVPVIASAYDATFNFSQSYPELVAGFKAKAGGVKGGPYPTVIDCKKPTQKTDGTFDCVVPNLSHGTLYGVVVNYDSTGKESAPSAEGTMTIPVSPPSNLKFTITGTVVLTPVQ